MEKITPAILVDTQSYELGTLDERERANLKRARDLFDSNFYDHALLEVWNAAINNLRRRVEAYGIDIFLSTIKDEPGRKKYIFNGESIVDRWSGVDDLALITGATRLGLLNKKAGKALEMINWMRNHASPAHDSDNPVGERDVIALSLLLEDNLFRTTFPDPVHSVSSIFKPIKDSVLDDDAIDLLNDQVRALRNTDVRVAFGFMLDLISSGKNPAFSNAKRVFPTLWGNAPDDIRKTAGLRYYTLEINPTSDDSDDKKAKNRILDALIGVGGIQYIPDASRARLYRRLGEQLAQAKDTIYGWKAEEAAAASLQQFGPYVPSTAFEEVYQEILAVWCGNYWGRSNAYRILNDFIEELSVDQIRTVARMFRSNERVREELFQDKPKRFAIELLNSLKDKLTLKAHKTEIDEAIAFVESL